MKALLCILGLVVGMSAASTLTGRAQAPTQHQVDSLAERALRTFNAPGLAIVIVKDGRVLCAKGYGVRSLRTRQPADANTLFGIASNSKAFTAAALGILVDEGKLGWDDKVIDYLPEFRLSDPYVTADFTIRDLLTHRSGLGPNAGDLMRSPDSAAFTLPDIMHNLRYLPLTAPFRSRYAYDNVLYLVAGELVHRVSGLSWGDFVTQRLFRPLGMASSGASYKRIAGQANVIDGHRAVNSQLETVPHTDGEIDAGAGGIYTSATDLSQWLLVQLNAGKYGPDLSRQLFSEAVHREMWTPQIPIPVGRSGIYNTHFGAYGLGWFLVDVAGQQQVFHTGQDDGMVSEIALLPEQHLGIAVLTNEESGGATRAIIDQLTDCYLGLHGPDRVQQVADRLQARRQAAATAPAALRPDPKSHAAPAGPAVDLRNYTGTYHDNWLGDVQIFQQKGVLWFRAARSPQLTGPLRPYHGTAFVIKWRNPQFQADAFALFTLDETGHATGLTLKAVSPTTSPAYDFQDLAFHRVKQ